MSRSSRKVLRRIAVLQMTTTFLDERAADDDDMEVADKDEKVEKARLGASAVSSHALPGRCYAESLFAR